VSELIRHSLSSSGGETATPLSTATDASLLAIPNGANHGRNCQTSPLIETDRDPFIEFKSLQYSLFITSFVEVLGGLFFLMTAWYIISDKMKADKAISGKISSVELLSQISCNPNCPLVKKLLFTWLLLLWALNQTERRYSYQGMPGCVTPS